MFSFLGFNWRACKSVSPGFKAGTLVKTSLHQNDDYGGGAIYVGYKGTTAKISQCTFENNTGRLNSKEERHCNADSECNSHSGGAVLVSNGVTLVSNMNSFQHNYAGTGFYDRGDSVAIAGELTTASFHDDRFSDMYIASNVNDNAIVVVRAKMTANGPHKIASESGSIDGTSTSTSNTALARCNTLNDKPCLQNERCVDRHTDPLANVADSGPVWTNVALNGVTASSGFGWTMQTKTHCGLSKDGVSMIPAVIGHDCSDVPSSLRSESLVAHWSLNSINESTGIVADDFGSYNGVSSADPPIANGDNGGMTFSANKKVTIPWSNALNPDEFTVTMWVKALSTSSSHQSPLTSRQNTSPTMGYLIYNVGGRWEFWTAKTNIGSWNVIQQNSAAVVLNTWQHLSISYGAKVMTLHVDGVPFTKTVQTFTKNTEFGFHIGAGSESGTGAFFDGDIKDVSFYSVVIPTADILILMHQPSQIFDTTKKGCGAAVFSNGDLAESYCRGYFSSAGDEQFPWWGACCEWKNNQCMAKPISTLPVSITLLRY